MALHVNRPNPSDPLDVLAKVGGYEIAGLIGMILGAATFRVLVYRRRFYFRGGATDCGRAVPPVRDYLIAAHNSLEIGHRSMLAHMDLAPLLHLDLRLGEGAGAALAMQLLDDAVAVLNQMATFTQAGVAQKEQMAQSAESSTP